MDAKSGVKNEEQQQYGFCTLAEVMLFFHGVSGKGFAFLARCFAVWRRWHPHVSGVL